MTRMYCHQEDWIYYLTVMNETYLHAAHAEGRRGPRGHPQGDVPVPAGPAQEEQGQGAHLLGSGAILNEALKAQEILEKDYGVAADVWSVTSYKELYRDAVECERWNLLNPAEEGPARPT